ncbi:MAG: hypothetical protein NTZ39_08475 [Methanoregula sp.]|nr:hypothetical protein [Methanoregula sp.]
MIGIVGAVLLILGCFAPLFSVTALGKTLSVTFFTIGFDIYGGALVLTALVIIGLLLVKKIQEAQGAGIAVFITILVFFADAVAAYNGIRDMGIIGSFAAGFFSFGYGWVILFAGAIILVAAPYVDHLCMVKS